MPQPQRYLVLPARGLQATAANASTAARDFLTSMVGKGAVASMRTRLHRTVSAGHRAVSLAIGKKLEKVASAAFEVLASLNEDGVKLISATPEMISALRYEQPGLRVVPEYRYRTAISRIELLPTVKAAGATAAAVQKKLTVTVQRADTGVVLKGVDVVGFTDFANRQGNGGKTKANGKVTLSVPNSLKYERLYVQHDLPGLWSFLGKNLSTQGVLTIKLKPLDLSATDSLRHFHTIGADGAGAGVKVGVIDSGIDTTHPDLNVAGGLGCVPGEPETDFGPHGSHGTHVAGTIAGRGNAPTGVRGIAPGVELRSYRVFGSSVGSGSSFALIKAIRRGVEDGCDLLNMSLGFDPDEVTGLPVVDEAVQEAIREAHQKGTLVIAAAGNDGRFPVQYPGSDDLVVAVSAIGRKGTFPAASSETGDLMGPAGADPKDFVAAFSNVGADLDMAGAGVGVVSTVPGGHAPMSGTSMACPAVTGVAARLLANDPAVLGMARNSNRTDAIKSLLFAQATSLGFGVLFEGKGLPK